MKHETLKHTLSRKVGDETIQKNSQFSVRCFIKGTTLSDETPKMKSILHPFISITPFSEYRFMLSRFVISCIRRCALWHRNEFVITRIKGEGKVFGLACEPFLDVHLKYHQHGTYRVGSCSDGLSCGCCWGGNSQY